MSCPRCHNFMQSHIDGGMCFQRCISCGYDEKVAGLMVHVVRSGAVRQVGSAVSRLDATVLENLSHDKTLFALPDKFCTKCGTQLRAWLSGTLYLLLCPQCHKPCSATGGDADAPSGSAPRGNK